VIGACFVDDGLSVVQRYGHVVPFGSGSNRQGGQFDFGPDRAAVSE
jgi:hypothetical protein